MAIKELITLEGAEQVKKALGDLGKAGEDALGQFRDLGKSTVTGQGFDQISKAAGTAGDGFHAASAGATNLTEALHVLRPVLQELGVHFVNIREFSVLARVGFEGLAVAITGAALVALAKLSDSTEKTKTRLQDLAQSKVGGATLFSQLEADAQRLGTTVATLAPAIEPFIKAFEQLALTGAKFVAAPGQILPPNIIGNLGDAEKAATALFAALRAGSGSGAEASAAVAKFGNELEKNKGITGEMLKQLRDVSPGAFNALSKQFNLGQRSAAEWIAEVEKTPITLRKVATVVASPLFDLGKTFDANAPKNFTDALDQLIARMNRLAVSIAGVNLSEILGSIITNFGNGIEIIVAGLQKVAEFFKTGLQITGFSQFIETTKQEFLGLVQFFSSAFTAGANIFAGMSAAFLDILTTIKTDAQAAWEQIKAIFTAPFDLSGLLSSFQSAWTTVVTGAQGAYDQIRSIFSQQIQLNIQGGGGFLQGGAPPFASGGRVSGQGTTTSDSILAFLSNREWVINARAVDFYGNALFSALNSMRLPRDLVMNTNKFAGGGQVTTGGTPVTLVLGGSKFDMQTSDETVSRLRRVAVRSQMASAGRAPGWVK